MVAFPEMMFYCSISVKRYRTTSFSFDSRPNILNTEIKDDWQDSVKSSWKENKEKVREGLRKEFGVVDFEQKEKNFIDIGATFPSIIFFHNKFLQQIRKSFVVGSYYPAFTGVTTLTERILNHLIFTLMDEFKLTPEFKEVYGKGSFTDWDMMLRVLSSWNVLLPETIDYIQKLKTLRHQYAAHFNRETDIKDRELGLEAIKLFQEFIRIQFGAFGKQPWFIEGTKGAFFIKKEFENDPFIKRIYLPNCLLVGPQYELTNSPDGFQLKDENYGNKEITDLEFKELLEKKI